MSVYAIPDIFVSLPSFCSPFSAIFKIVVLIHEIIPKQPKVNNFTCPSTKITTPTVEKQRLQRVARRKECGVPSKKEEDENNSEKQFNLERKIV